MAARTRGGTNVDLEPIPEVSPYCTICGSSYTSNEEAAACYRGHLYSRILCVARYDGRQCDRTGVERISERWFCAECIERERGGEMTAKATTTKTASNKSTKPDMDIDSLIKAMQQTLIQDDVLFAKLDEIMDVYVQVQNHSTKIRSLTAQIMELQTETEAKKSVMREHIVDIMKHYANLTLAEEKAPIKAA